MAEKQSAGRRAERSRIRNSLGPTGFSCRQRNKSAHSGGPIRWNAYGIEPSPFAHRARPSPLSCENEYVLHALGGETAVQAAVDSIVWALRRLKEQGSVDERI